MTWCWQATYLTKHQLFARAYLFSTLYRFFRAGYQGNGLYLTPTKVSIPRRFKELFLSLPLDLQQNVANRIWNKGQGYNEIIVRDNHRVLPLSLEFLFAIYGRLKYTTSLITPLGIGMWIGSKISIREYDLFLGNHISMWDHWYPISWIRIPCTPPL